MKKIHKVSGIVFLSLGLILIFGFHSIRPNDQMPKTILVKSFDSGWHSGSAWSRVNSTLYIYYGNNKVDSIEVSPKANVLDQVITTLNKLNSEGYEVISFSYYGSTYSNREYLLRRKD